MEHTFHALCVRTVDYKDNDKLLTLLTAENGKVLVKATGVKSQKAKLKFCSMSLCFGEYEVVETHERYTLKGCNLYDAFSDLALDLKRYYAGFSILEWLDKLSNDADIDTIRDIMLLGAKTLEELTYNVEIEPENSLVKFLNNLLNILGYGLNFDTCAISGESLKGRRVCYDFIALGIVDFSCRGIDYIDFSDKDIAILANEECGNIFENRKLLDNLSHILHYQTGLKGNYSLSEFNKL